jgi:NTP pyrophosphatase (non-canonical NTP hydrolase)
MSCKNCKCEKNSSCQNKGENLSEIKIIGESMTNKTIPVTTINYDLSPTSSFTADTITGLTTQRALYDSVITTAYPQYSTVPVTTHPDSFGIVEKFMQACDQFPGKDQEDLYVKLITEEYNEFLEGIKNNDRVEILDAICDLVWVLNGYAVAAKFNYNDAFNEVAASNMSKIDPVTNKAIKNEYGKVMKPASYFAPDLTKFV